MQVLKAILVEVSRVCLVGELVFAGSRWRIVDEIEDVVEGLVVVDLLAGTWIDDDVVGELEVLRPSPASILLVVGDGLVAEVARLA